jgi:hypothetical protein
MAKEEKKKPARIVSDSGATMMALESLGREGDRIVIQGRMIGAISTKMYMNLDDVLRIGGMMIKNRALIGYIVSLPYLVLKRRKGKTE